MGHCHEGPGDEQRPFLSDIRSPVVGTAVSYVVANRRAIAAYRRAGFELLLLTAAEQRMEFVEGDCEDSVVLSKRIG